MRGWSCEWDQLKSWGLVFPAHAGVIPLYKPNSQSFPCFSRTCGGDPKYPLLNLFFASFSRTCGGDPKKFKKFVDGIVFFPHMRGWSQGKRSRVVCNCVFPAHAGVIPDLSIMAYCKFCFSRTRGGDPKSIIINSQNITFFPHTRGWSWSEELFMINLSVFPAHAGVIPCISLATRWRKSFSRTCGGDPEKVPSGLTLPLFFPHTRGWSYKFKSNDDTTISIDLLRSLFRFAN